MADTSSSGLLGQALKPGEYVAKKGLVFLARVRLIYNRCQRYLRSRPSLLAMEELCETLWQDIRFAVRTLKTIPDSQSLPVLILALGIGATTAVFSIVNAVLLRPLPYADPARLVAVSSLYQPGKANQNVSAIALTDMEQWRKESRTLESMGAFAYTELPIRVGEQAVLPGHRLDGSGVPAHPGQPARHGNHVRAAHRGGPGQHRSSSRTTCGLRLLIAIRQLSVEL